MEIQNKNLDLGAGFQKKLILISSFRINFHYKCIISVSHYEGESSLIGHTYLQDFSSTNARVKSMKAKLNRLLIYNQKLAFTLCKDYLYQSY